MQRVPWLPQVVAKSFFRWTHKSRNLSAWGLVVLAVIIIPKHLTFFSLQQQAGHGWVISRWDLQLTFEGLAGSLTGKGLFSYKTSSELIVVTTSDSESPGYRVCISVNVIMVNCSFYWAIIPRLSVYFFSLFFSHNRSIFSWYKIFQTNGSNASIFSFTTPETSTQTTPIQTPKVNSEHVKINLKKEKRTRNMILVKGKTVQRSLN